MDRLERLVNLVAALIDTPRPLTRAEIRDRIEGYSAEPEAFRRNFERDKDLLRQMGFPLVVEAPEGAGPDEAGYRIPREQYELPDPGLDEEELAALRLAASVVQLEGEWSEALVRALRKLGGAAAGGGSAGGRPGPQGGDAVATAAATIPAQDAATAAFVAIGERRRVRFSYRREVRTVEPWRLSFGRGHWYLSGWDADRQGERQFRLDRLDGPIELVGPPAAFDRPASERSQPPPPWRMGDDDETLVRIRVDAEQAGWAERALGPWADTGRADDGSAVFELGVTSRPALISFVLGYLDHAEVLGPPEVRDAVVAWLESVP